MTDQPPSRKRDHYRLLGVSRDATTAEIRTAFRRLARQNHPDMTRDTNARRFRRLREAYEVLSQPERRADYDCRADGIHVPVRVVRRSAYQTAEPLRPRSWRAGARRPTRPEPVSNDVRDLLEELDRVFLRMLSWR